MRLLGAVLAAGAALVPAAGMEAPATLMGVGYICAAERWTPAHTEQPIKMVEGMGTGGFVAPVADAQAKAWLDYGLKLYHAFYHADAKAAFARAVEAAPDCSLCAAGQALGLGPTLNFRVSDADTALALTAARRAMALAKTPFERDLAAVLEKRYLPAGEPDEPEHAYGAAMAELAARYPEETDVADLAAHALITRPPDGDKSAEERAMAILERTLARHPDDTAAIHYYIHASEGVDRPLVALPYAPRLAALAPAASHLSHMASHTLLYLGRYEDVAVVNARAMSVDTTYATRQGKQGNIGAPRYYAHNLMFGSYGAIMAGDADLALRYADHAAKAYPPAASGPVEGCGVCARANVAYGRFTPDRALAMAAPAAKEAIFQMYWRYMRGEAFAMKGDAAGAAQESRLIAATKTEPGGFVPEVQAMMVKVLAARAAMLRGDSAGAARLYTEAADLQATFPDTDPPLWWYPVRRSVAAAWLKAGDAGKAAEAARKSLVKSPADALALKVLAEAEARLGQGALAAAHRAEAKRAYLGDVSKVRAETI